MFFTFSLYFSNLPRQHLKLLFHRSQCTQGVQFHSLAPSGGSLLPNVVGSRYASLVCSPWPSPGSRGTDDRMLPHATEIKINHDVNKMT